MFARQRVALLQVWKSFEEQHGMAEDIAKVEGMMPVQGKRRYVDEETGQLVEGMRLDSRRFMLREESNTYQPATRQITTTSLQTTSARQTRLHSSSFKWRMHGRPLGRPEVPAMLPAMVAVAVAVHYQGSLRHGHRMIPIKIVGPNPIVVGTTSPWTRTWRVWQARKATHKRLGTHAEHDACFMITMIKCIVLATYSLLCTT